MSVEQGICFRNSDVHILDSAAEGHTLESNLSVNHPTSSIYATVKSDLLTTSYEQYSTLQLASLDQGDMSSCKHAKHGP